MIVKNILSSILSEEKNVSNKMFYLYFKLLGSKGIKEGRIPLKQMSKSENDLSIDNVDLINVFNIIGNYLKQKNGVNEQDENQQNTSLDVLNNTPQVSQPNQDKETNSPQMTQDTQSQQPQEDKKQQQVGLKLKQLDNLFSDYNQIIISVASDNESSKTNEIKGKVGIWLKKTENGISFSEISNGQKQQENQSTFSNDTIVNTQNKIEDYIRSST